MRRGIASGSVPAHGHGGLKMRHCNAAHAPAVLDRYAGRTGDLLPEQVGPADLELMARRLEPQRRETVRSLLALMTRDKLGRFLPFLLGNPDPAHRRGCPPER